MAKSIPTSRLARGGVAATTAAVVGAKKLSFITKKPFLSEKNLTEAQKAHDEDVASTVFNSLAKLRGTALKAGQMLSLEAGLLPENYRRQLFKAHYQAPPLNRAVIRKLMMSQFGRPPEEVFKEFSEEAFAAASLGQVHRARSTKGEDLAVKIQYPGIGNTISGDMLLVRQIVSPFFRSPFVGRMIGEIENRLNEETDYRREFASTEWFRENLKMPNIVIPRAHERFSTEAVITTDFVEGMQFDEFLKTNPSQETRNHYGQLLYDLFMNCMNRLHRLHADPNPGNYLFRKDGTIGLIDFGCTKHLTADFCAKMAELWRAHIHHDLKKVKELYYEVGMQGSKDYSEWERMYDDVIAPFGKWLALPLQVEYFDFGANPDYCDKVAPYMGKIISHPAFHNFTTDTLFIDRTVYGMFRIFTQLGAKIKFGNQWLY